VRQVGQLPRNETVFHLGQSCETEVPIVVTMKNTVLQDVMAV